MTANPILLTPPVIVIPTPPVLVIPTHIASKPATKLGLPIIAKIAKTKSESGTSITPHSTSNPPGFDPHRDRALYPDRSSGDSKARGFRESSTSHQEAYSNYGDRRGNYDNSSYSGRRNDFNRNNYQRSVFPSAGYSDRKDDGGENTRNYSTDGGSKSTMMILPCEREAIEV